MSIKMPPEGILEEASPRRRARLLVPVLVLARLQAAHLPTSVSGQPADPSRIAQNYPREVEIALVVGPLPVAAAHPLDSLLSRETMVR